MARTGQARRDAPEQRSHSPNSSHRRPQRRDEREAAKPQANSGRLRIVVVLLIDRCASFRFQIDYDDDYDDEDDLRSFRSQQFIHTRELVAAQREVIQQFVEGVAVEHQSDFLFALRATDNSSGAQIQPPICVTPVGLAFSGTCTGHCGDRADTKPECPSAESAHGTLHLTFPRARRGNSGTQPLLAFAAFSLIIPWCRQR